MDKMMKDRVAIITGSGRGIGRAAAMMMAAHGAKVVISDIDSAPADETVAAIQDAGGEAISYVGDATAEGFAEGIVGAAAEKWGGIHIIVNNAGYTWDGTIHKMTDKMWDAMLNIHLKTPFNLIRAASPYFRDAAKKEMEQGISIPRKIVNVTSVAGTHGNAGQANYSSAKAGIVGLTKTMCKEWGRFNVQSNAVAFGWVETRLTASKEGADDIERGGEKVQLGIPETQRQMMKMIIPLGRAGTPEEAANVIFFLASPFPIMCLVKLSK